MQKIAAQLTSILFNGVPLLVPASLAQAAPAANSANKATRAKERLS